jgi:uncharacterized flavoprotein (TIGR03862 family)
VPNRGGQFITNDAQTKPARANVAVIGGGPAGLMAAEVLSAGGAQVTVYERMPNVGRKLLMAGRGGLNLTHSEPFESFLTRYGAASAILRAALEAFPSAAVTAWAEGLGQPVFTGSSGRIFPKTLKASPLLRAWLARLRAAGVKFETRHDWQGWDESGALVFCALGARKIVHADATILALGGASWPKLGANGAWTEILTRRGIAVNPLRPANCGFTISWSDRFRARFAGTPLKNAALSFCGTIVRGEAMITDYGIEGGAIYALSAQLRDAIAAEGIAELRIDLRPNSSGAQLTQKLDKPRAKQSMANVLRKSVHLSPMEINLLREVGVDAATAPEALAQAIKAATLHLTGAQEITRAISSAGGVAFSSLDETFMLRAVPGCFVAGEMLDWEAPTGGYLLQACLSTGFAAGHAVLRRLDLEAGPAWS